jgi:hypothetical protein
MVIKASAASEIRSLVQALSGDDDVRRESAAARLAVIGSRAVPHIIAAYRAETNRATRVPLMRALERTADPRATAVACAALEEGGDLAVAAIGVLRVLLESREGQTGPRALDALMAVALDAGVEHRARRAAIDAVKTIPAVREKLAGAIGAATEGPPERDSLWKDALEGRLPDDPRLLRDALDAHGRSEALSALQKLVDAVRARESQPGPQRAGWLSLRGAIHQALALRGSRVALYDLRETLEAAEAGLPTSFIGAVQLVGNAACLEALATAHARAPEADERWRAQLATAFRAVAAREHATRRHAVIKRILQRWPEAAPQLLARPLNTPSRTTPRRPRACRT